MLLRLILTLAKHYLLKIKDVEKRVVDWTGYYSGACSDILHINEVGFWANA